MDVGDSLVSARRGLDARRLPAVAQEHHVPWPEVRVIWWP